MSDCPSKDCPLDRLPLEGPPLEPLQSHVASGIQLVHMLVGRGPLRESICLFTEVWVPCHRAFRGEPLPGSPARRTSRCTIAFCTRVGTAARACARLSTWSQLADAWLSLGQGASEHLRPASSGSGGRGPPHDHAQRSPALARLYPNLYPNLTDLLRPHCTPLHLVRSIAVRHLLRQTATLLQMGQRCSHKRPQVISAAS